MEICLNISLNSCNTGNGPESVGADLSLEMKEATVVAPTCSVTPNGQGVENGSWEVYVGGRVVRSVEATEKAYSALLKQLDLEYAKKYEGAK